jgi:hypothetical protein
MSKSNAENIALFIKYMNNEHIINNNEKPFESVLTNIEFLTNIFADDLFVYLNLKIKSNVDLAMSLYNKSENHNMLLSQLESKIQKYNTIKHFSMETQNLLRDLVNLKQ